MYLVYETLWNSFSHQRPSKILVKKSIHTLTLYQASVNGQVQPIIIIFSKYIKK